MIIKIVASKPKSNGAERYARHLASYMADGDRRWLQPDAIGIDYGLTLSAYMTGAKEPQPVRERVLYRGAWSGGATEQWDKALREVERRLAMRSRKVKKPVRHGILSCRAKESLSEDQCVDAVAVMAKELGCESAMILWAAHVDTDNFHLHAMFVTVDAATGAALPFGQEQDGRAGYKEALQRAIARIEHTHRLQPEMGSRYEMQGGEPVRKPQAGVMPRKRTPLRQEVLAWEEASGFASLTRYAQDVAEPILDAATSWAELHRDLAPHGLGIRASVNGGALHAGEERVKLSNVDRRHSWAQLQKRLGEFEPSDGVSISAYTPQVRDHAKAAGWLDRSRRLREVSDQLDRRIAALIASRDAALAEVEAQVSAHRADMAGFDGDPRLRQDLLAAWPRLRATAAAAVRSAFGARLDAVRALRQSAASCDDLTAVDVASLGIPDVGIVAPWQAGARSPAPATLAGFDGERRDEVVCYWSREDPARRGQPAFVDAGAVIWINQRSSHVVEAALTLAQQRFGAVAVFGDAAYLRQCRLVAERLGIDLEVISVREAKRRARRNRQEVEVARQRAVGNGDQRPAAARLRAWARAYRRAAPDEDAERASEPIGDLRHHTTIETASISSDKRAGTRTSEAAKRRTPMPVNVDQSPDWSI